MRLMITNFALSLSFQGIELLHRVQHGWKRVGTADVEADDLDAQLRILRDKANVLAPDGLRTKLIIPLDQIKYTAIDSTQTTDADIHAELDGTTPYALDELVIDCERFGGRTHIAAVARETLAEAEAFAHAHGFRPVCFAAIPEPFTFQKEVFFGPTSLMNAFLGADGTVERDTLPVMIVGTRIKSRLLVFDLPEDALPPADDFDLAAALAPHLAEDKPDVNIIAELDDAIEAPAPKEPKNSAPEDEDLAVEEPAAEVEIPATEEPAPDLFAQIAPEDPVPSSDETIAQAPFEAVEDPAPKVEAQAPAIVKDGPAPFVPALFDRIISEFSPAPIAPLFGQPTRHQR